MTTRAVMLLALALLACDPSLPIPADSGECPGATGESETETAGETSGSSGSSGSSSTDTGTEDTAGDVGSDTGDTTTGSPGACCSCADGTCIEVADVSECAAIEASTMTVHEWCETPSECETCGPAAVGGCCTCKAGQIECVPATELECEAMAARSGESTEWCEYGPPICNPGVCG